MTPPARSEREHADDCATHWDLAAECTCTQTDWEIVVTRTERYRVRADDADSAETAFILWEHGGGPDDVVEQLDPGVRAVVDVRGVRR